MNSIRIVIFCSFFLLLAGDAFGCVRYLFRSSEQKNSGNQLNSLDGKDASKVEVALYFESLCAGCHQFILTQMWPAWQTVQNIVHFTFYAYGNAEEKYDEKTGRYVFTCQHGPDECLGNLYLTCGIHYLQDHLKYVPYVHCMTNATKTSKNPQDWLSECAPKHGLIWDAIFHCSKSKLGNDLEHSVALATEKTGHEYVPWVTVNGKHSKEAQGNLIKAICDAYQGTKPPACNKVQFETIRKGSKCWLK